jgi:hypothetical protein
VVSPVPAKSSQMYRLRDIGDIYSDTKLIFTPFNEIYLEANNSTGVIILSIIIISSNLRSRSILANLALVRCDKRNKTEERRGVKEGDYHVPDP